MPCVVVFLFAIGMSSEAPYILEVVVSQASKRLIRAAFEPRDSTIRYLLLDEIKRNMLLRSVVPNLGLACCFQSSLRRFLKFTHPTALLPEKSNRSRISIGMLSRPVARIRNYTLPK